MKKSLILLASILFFYGCNNEKVALNRAPVISGTAPQTVDVNNNYTFKPNSFDEDNDSLTYTITNKPEWAEFDPTLGLLSGKPTLNNVGEYKNIIISVTDGEKSHSLAPFNIRVLDSNIEFLSSKKGNLIREKLVLDLDGIETLKINISHPQYVPLPTNNEIKNQQSDDNSHSLENYPDGYIGANTITIKHKEGKYYLYNLSYSKIDSVFVEVLNDNGSKSIKKIEFNQSVNSQTIYELDNFSEKNITIVKSDELFNSKVRFFNKNENDCSIDHSCTGSETVYRKATLGERLPILGYFSNMHSIYNSVDIIPIFEAWAYQGTYDQNRDGEEEIDFSNFKKPCNVFDECKIDSDNSVPTEHDFMKVIDEESQKSYLYRAFFRSASPSNRTNLKIIEYINSAVLGLGGTVQPTSNFGDRLTTSSGLSLRKGLLVDLTDQFKAILQTEYSEKYDKNGNLLSNPLSNRDYKKYKKTDEYKRRYKEYRYNYEISASDNISSTIYEVGHHELMHSFGFGHASGMTYGFSTAIKKAIVSYFDYTKPQINNLPNIFFKINANKDNNLIINVRHTDSKEQMLADEVTVEILSPNSVEADFYKKDNQILLHFGSIPVNRFFLRIYDANSHQVMSKLIYPLDFKNNSYDTNTKKYFLVSYSQWKDIVNKPANYARLQGDNGSLKAERALLSYKMKAKEAENICKGWSGDLNAKTINLDDIPMLFNRYLKDNIESKIFFSHNKLYDLSNYNYQNGDQSEQLPPPLEYKASAKLNSDSNMDSAYILCERNN